MATIYSVRFLQGHGATSDLTYVVPVGYVAVVRDVDCYASVIGNSAVFLHGAAGQAIWYAAWNAGDQETKQWRGRQVFEAGESIVLHPEMAPLDAVDATVSGYLLTAP